MILRRLFARSAADEAANIRESIRRDNLRGIFADPQWVRGEYLSDHDRARKMLHVLREDQA